MAIVERWVKACNLGIARVDVALQPGSLPDGRNGVNCGSSRDLPVRQNRVRSSPDSRHAGQRLEHFRQVEGR
jgi:hypothetical protein